MISAAKEQWNHEVFSKVTTTDLSNNTLLEMLYSGLYKMHLMPSDRTGDNPNWETEEPSYDVGFTVPSICKKSNIIRISIPFGIHSVASTATSSSPHRRGLQALSDRSLIFGDTSSSCPTGDLGITMEECMFLVYPTNYRPLLTIN